MIPLVLVCGFLGSGKTTVLRHWARTEANRRLVFVVNEFSSRDVDSVLLGQDAKDVVPLPGGSIFCRCLAADFHRTMTALASGGWDAIVAEASGIADPSSTRTLLAETGLDRSLRLAELEEACRIYNEEWRTGSWDFALRVLPSLEAVIREVAGLSEDE
ncbi:MAG: GTP-binding protein, partial [Fimbriimonadales bacterium]